MTLFKFYFNFIDKYNFFSFAFYFKSLNQLLSVIGLCFNSDSIIAIDAASANQPFTKQIYKNHKSCQSLIHTPIINSKIINDKSLRKKSFLNFYWLLFRRYSRFLLLRLCLDLHFPHFIHLLSQIPHELLIVFQDVTSLSQNQVLLLIFI